MLTELRIQNFKSWSDTQTMRLAPITVFFGTNSSGKSSIGQLLLMLKQTAESPDRTRVLNTGDQQAPVDLGDFRSLIHHHDDTLDLSFELAWKQSDAIVIDDPKDELVHHKGNLIRFRASIFQPPARPGQLRVRNMSYELLDGDAAPFRAGMEPDSRRSSRYKLMFEGFSPVRNRGRSWELPAPGRFYGFPDEAVASSGPGTASTNAKPAVLSSAEKLVRALKACQKLKKSKRASCIAAAKKRFAPKHKRHRRTQSNTKRL
jgi:hypothetical protein